MVLSFSEANRILREIVMPLIVEELNRDSHLLRWLEEADREERVMVWIEEVEEER